MPGPKPDNRSSTNFPVMVQSSAIEEDKQSEVCGAIVQWRSGRAVVRLAAYVFELLPKGYKKKRSAVETADL